ncbi:translation initiation factor IF-2 [Levilinea saccharolytica]|uniref:Translation initiation factor IF-2 n=1 Tax=Levilinea saccharolytica TaxID=229921 RepID=A0A0P6Y249_9CHLR|nr:translation initiation factor IF-2 [Levilinea saccharolytica]KPL75760.1 translation initiation factor IF-2 [Levilinea saccharolytica]GAP17476.1 translation initiation factor IF-2 [Levilinea saccharolytica]
MSETGLKKIELPHSITVRDLGQRMDASPIQVIKILMTNGVMANINQLVDFDTAAIVANELGFEAALESLEEVEEKETGEIPLWRQVIMNEDPRSLVKRPPVVTILGHVDHGKTTLLDAIRHSNVASGEAGGITQHIGAYQVEHHNQLITFLDTPGHAAFTAMRARGAQGADIVVLVVAANDGVMPQTREAIAHAKAARVPIIVALNKVDRPDSNPDFVKRQLAENGLVPDEWDGDTMIVPVSAKQKMGIEDLLEAILLVSDSMDIRANPNGKVLGTVIEAQVEKAKGVIATLLVQNGSLEMGDIIVAGTSMGRIRAMFDYRNRKLRKAGPSMPVLVMGLSDVPAAGDIFQVYKNDREARAVVEERKTQAQNRQAAVPKATLEQLFERYQAGETRELCLLLKADVQGSLEPIVSELKDLNKSEIKVTILQAEAGNVSENDVMLAAASKAIVLGFNVTADTAARRLAEAEGVSIRLYDIIYRLTEDIEKALKGMLEPEFKEVPLGKAEVLAVFNISKVGNIAGCRVTQGEVRRNGKARVLRAGKVIFEGDISSLKHERDDVREVRQGYDCGISFRNFDDMQAGDQIECYTIERFGS